MSPLLRAIVRAQSRGPQHAAAAFICAVTSAPATAADDGCRDAPVACASPQLPLAARQWAAAQHAACAAQWASVEAIAREVDDGVIGVCLDRASALALALAELGNLTAARGLAEWVLHAGEACGVWTTAMWHPGRCPSPEARSSRASAASRDATPTAPTHASGRGGNVSAACTAPWLTVDRCLCAGGVPGVARALRQLGCVVAFLGAVRVAMALHAQALQMRQRLVGPASSTDVAQSLNDLAMSHRVTGQVAAAVKLHTKALDMYEAAHRATGRERHNLVRTYTWLALAHLSPNSGGGGGGGSSKARAKAALKHAREATRLAKAVHGESTRHRDTACALRVLGQAHHVAGQYEQAERCYADAMVMFEAIYGGSDHRDVALTATCLAHLAIDAGPAPASAVTAVAAGAGAHYARRVAPSSSRGARAGQGEAAGLLEQALLMLQRLYGEDVDHLDVARVLQGQVRLYKWIGESLQANSRARRVLHMARRLGAGRWQLPWLS